MRALRVTMEPRSFAEAHYPLGGPAVHFDLLSIAGNGIQPRVTRQVGQHTPRWQLEAVSGAVGEPVVKTWRCEVCDLTFEGTSPPS